MKIVFVQGTSIIDKIICWYTDSKYSHCFLQLDNKVGNDSLILESTSLGGVKLNLLSTYKSEVTETFEVLDGFNDISSIASRIGSAYGYLEILGFPISRLFHLHKNIFSQGIICTQLVILWLQNSPLASEFNNLDPADLSPGKLYKIVSASSSFKRC